MPRDDALRARRATAVLFALTGLISGTWAARIPAVQDRLDLSPGQLALAVTAVELGALGGLTLGGAAVARIGSRRGLQGGIAVFAPLLVAPAVVPSVVWLCVALAVWAIANSVIDVALNVHGAGLERRLSRPVLSRLHAGQAFGLLAGGAGTIAATAAHVGFTAHAAAIAVVALATARGAARHLAAEGRFAGSASSARPGRAVALLGVVAFCVFLAEGAAVNWAAVHLGSERGASPALAAGAFTAFALTVALVRLGGDRIVGGLGRPRAVRAGALVTAAGITLAVAMPWPGAALAGWALSGAGVAVLVPAILGAAPAAAPGLAPAAAIAGVTTLGYIGSLASPTLIGSVAGVAGLSAALGVAVLAALVAAVLGPRAMERPRAADRVSRARR